MPTAVAIDKPFELERNERQLWAGAPRQGLVFRPSDALMIPFSVLWAGFAVIWEASALRGGAPGFFALWGIPFVLFGLYFTVGRFFGDAWRRTRTAYALTNERIIIRSATSMKSLNLRTLSDVTLTERADGSGTITFGPNPFPPWMTGGMQWPGIAQAPSFELIPSARQVYAQIRDAQRASTTRAD